MKIKRAVVTEAELAVLREIATTGATNREVAERLGVSYQTVKNHLSGAYKGLGVKNITGAFIALGWLRPTGRNS